MQLPNVRTISRTITVPQPPPESEQAGNLSCCKARYKGRHHPKDCLGGHMYRWVKRDHMVGPSRGEVLVGVVGHLRAWSDSQGWAWGPRGTVCGSGMGSGCDHP